MIIVIFQIVFYLEIHQNDIFFKKFIFDVNTLK